MTGKNSYRLPPLVHILCFLTAALVLAVCSESSPLYPYNTWVDSNCFFTVGRGMLHGLVPYRDLIEQKGPLLYFLHMLAAIVSEKSFLGVYFLEVIAGYLFLLTCWKITQLYQNHWGFVIVPAMAFLLYTSAAMCLGDSAEEFCLPMLLWAVYVSLRAAREERLFTGRECFFIGVTSGMVFWIKYSLVGMYLGWFFLPAAEMIWKRQWKALLRTVGWIALGVAVSTLPWVLYFGYHHAVSDWLQIYIFDNFTYYPAYHSSGDDGAVLSTIKGAFGVPLAFYYQMSCAAIVGFAGLVLGLWREKKRAYLRLLFMMAGMTLTTFPGGVWHAYAVLPLGMFALFGLIYAASLLPEPKIFVRRAAAPLAVIAALISSFYLTPNRTARGEEREDLPQFRFAEIISADEDATLLNYGFLDGGFYTAAGILPNCRMFCRLNIQTPGESQDDYVQQKLCRYIVTCTYGDETSPEFDGYDIIAEASTPGSSNSYQLYRLTE